MGAMVKKIAEQICGWLRVLNVEAKKIIASTSSSRVTNVRGTTPFATSDKECAAARKDHVNRGVYLVAAEDGHGCLRMLSVAHEVARIAANTE